MRPLRRPAARGRPVHPTTPLADAPPGAENVEGEPAAPPWSGFGQLWSKRYAVRIAAEDDPVAVMDTWKRRFSSFWPGRSSFLHPRRGISEGGVAGVEIELAPGAVLSTGSVVLASWPEGFTLLTARGHPFAGWITFSAARSRSGPGCIARVEAELRTGDPLYEVGMRLAGHAREDRFWKETLQALAAAFGTLEAPVSRRTEVLDPGLRWRHAGNVVHNAAIRTFLHWLTRPASRLASRRRPA